MTVLKTKTLNTHSRKSVNLGVIHVKAVLIFSMDLTKV